MNTMTKDEILYNIQHCVNGRMIRICYRTEVPVKAEFRKMGVLICKEVEETVRLGVEYSHISSVIEKRAEQIQKSHDRQSNAMWVMKNKLLYNANTEKNYLRVTPMAKGGNREVAYRIIANGMEQWYDEIPAEYREAVQESYFKEHTSVVKNVCLDNIVSLGRRIRA